MGIKLSGANKSDCNRVAMQASTDELFLFTWWQVSTCLGLVHVGTTRLLSCRYNTVYCETRAMKIIPHNLSTSMYMKGIDSNTICLIEKKGFLAGTRCKSTQIRASSTLCHRNLKREVLLWKCVKCFLSTVWQRNWKCKNRPVILNFVFD